MPTTVQKRVNAGITSLERQKQQRNLKGLEITMVRRAPGGFVLGTSAIPLALRAWSLTVVGAAAMRPFSTGSFRGFAFNPASNVEGRPRRLADEAKPLRSLAA